jgi:hypothetical protein
MESNQYYREKYDLDWQCRAQTQLHVGQTEAPTRKREVKHNLKKLKGLL